MKFSQLLNAYRVWSINNKRTYDLNRILQILLLSPLLLVLITCGGGGGGSGENNNSFAPLELIDPTPGASDLFGSIVVALSNGNIVVSDPNDSSLFTNNGAVHLFSLTSSIAIASIYGDAADDQLGSTSITALPNGNFVVVSIFDDAVFSDVGSVRLVDGTTGVQIGPTLIGDFPSDQLGSGGVTALGNSNYVVVTPLDLDVAGGTNNAGSVRLVNGTTGLEISALIGDTAGDQVGNGGIFVLGNGNYVVSSFLDNEGVARAGSVRLYDGTTGLQIGPTLAGDNALDALSLNGITVLGNNNFVVASDSDDVNGVSNSGSVRLVSGATGLQIGPTLAGDDVNDYFGTDSTTENNIAALSNDNFVVVSVLDDVGGIMDAGSVRLIDGATGLQIGTALVGDFVSDRLGSGGVTALGNNNYVVASPVDNEAMITDAGSVRLVDGATNLQIGPTLAGDNASDQFGNGGVTALSNGNYVVASPTDNGPGALLFNAGSVHLLNGATGVQIAAFAGNVATDELGSAGITTLGNNNIVISTPFDNSAIGVLLDSGSARLINGASGVEINALEGDSTGELFGFTGITALTNSNFVVASEFDEEGGVSNTGVVRLVSGASGGQIGSSIVGIVAADVSEAKVTNPVSGSFYILSLPRFNNGGLVDSGRVLLQSSM